ncbi:MAG: D-alanine--D-alanine ligase [bacterium]|nr:D-alanine--D-alanine ligase [bacterium]
MKINVVCGGNSKEREVSLRSGIAVANGLIAKGHTVKIMDTSASDQELLSCDVTFPVLHGVGGEDGSFQLRLENLGIAYAGSDSKSSALCMDKSAYRDFMISNGFLMPEGAILNLSDYANSIFANQPHVIKPVNGGSSIDTLIIRDADNIDRFTVEELFKTHSKMVVEQLIIGDELTVGILNEEVLPAIEIIPPADGEFDYENKYNGKTQELCPPKNVSESIQLEAKELCLKVHEAAGCRDFSRTDFMIADDEKIYLLETNTIPGMTEQSLFPKMALTAGINMPELVDRIVSLAVSR